jgi:hypothetical protein
MAPAGSGDAAADEITEPSRSCGDNLLPRLRQDLISALEKSIADCAIQTKNKEGKERQPQEILWDLEHQRNFIRDLQQELLSLDGKIREHQRSIQRNVLPLLSLDNTIVGNIASFLEEEDLWAFEIACIPHLEIGFFDPQWKLLENPSRDLVEKRFSDRDFRGPAWDRGILLARASRLARKLEQSARIRYGECETKIEEEEVCPWPDTIFHYKDLNPYLPKYQTGFEQHIPEFFVRISYNGEDKDGTSLIESYAKVLTVDIDSFEKNHSGAYVAFWQMGGRYDDGIFSKLGVNTEDSSDPETENYSSLDWPIEAQKTFMNHVWMTFLAYNPDRDKFQLVLSTGGYHRSYGSTSDAYCEARPRIMDLRDRGLEIRDRSNRVNAGIEIGFDCLYYLRLNWGCLVSDGDEKDNSDGGT